MHILFFHYARKYQLIERGNKLFVVDWDRGRQLKGCRMILTKVIDTRLLVEPNLTKYNAPSVAK